MVITVTSLSFLPSSCDDDDDGCIITLSSLSFLPDGHDDDRWWEDHGSNFLFIDRCLTHPTAYSCFSEQTPPQSTHLSHSPACLTTVHTVPLQQIWYHPLLCCMHLSPRYSGHMTPLSTRDVCATPRHPKEGWCTAHRMCCVRCHWHLSPHSSDHTTPVSTHLAQRCVTTTLERRMVHCVQDVLCQMLQTMQLTAGSPGSPEPFWALALMSVSHACPDLVQCHEGQTSILVIWKAV